ncbi:tRNA adenosine(34) deaminase TadA [Sodalis sp. CWE]|uniref:tRNA adenosine(34) deaminase TadA n=1 Tax=Sodalis sp. CWE TaxID=2803816 RepID=UPI001C7CA37F|nr:tRNA adenosine(34) deaminase TadA [Sodalis sp. CWE]MBX4181028.1 tRNA adenosine(34) deaminase TadA [Sodalis sp. CWE]
MNHYNDEICMRYAINLAKYAESKGEVPVGSILVLNGSIIGEGWNCSIEHCDPVAHAEIIALQSGAAQIGNYRLLKATLYVTMEPCVMCAGAMIQARISRLVFGAKSEKTGAAGSLLNVFNYPNLNHQIKLTGDVLSQDCSNQLSNFFRQRRRKNSF